MTGERGAWEKAIDVFLEDLEAMQKQYHQTHIVFIENEKETQQVIALLANSLKLLDKATRRRWKAAVRCPPSGVLEPAPKKQRSQDQA